MFDLVVLSAETASETDPCVSCQRARLCGRRAGSSALVNGELPRASSGCSSSSSSGAEGTTGIVEQGLEMEKNARTVVLWAEEKYNLTYKTN